MKRRRLPIGLSIGAIIGLLCFAGLMLLGRTNLAFWFGGVALLCALAAFVTSARPRPATTR